MACNIRVYSFELYVQQFANKSVRVFIADACVKITERRCNASCSLKLEQEKLSRGENNENRNDAYDWDLINGENETKKKKIK